MYPVICREAFGLLGRAITPGLTPSKNRFFSVERRRSLRASSGSRCYPVSLPVLLWKVPFGAVRSGVSLRQCLSPFCRCIYTTNMGEKYFIIKYSYKIFFKTLFPA